MKMILFIARVLIDQFEKERMRIARTSHAKIQTAVKIKLYICLEQLC